MRSKLTLFKLGMEDWRQPPGKERIAALTVSPKTGRLRTLHRSDRVILMKITAVCISDRPITLSLKQSIPEPFGDMVY